MQDGALQDINSALLSAARHKPAMAVPPANLLNLDYTHGRPGTGQPTTACVQSAVAGQNANHSSGGFRQNRL